MQCGHDTQCVACSEQITLAIDDLDSIIETIKPDFEDNNND